MRAGLHAIVSLTWLASIASPAVGAVPGATPRDAALEAGVRVAGGAGPVGLGEESPRLVPPGTVSEFALLSPLVAEDLLAARGMTREKKKPKEKAPAEADSAAQGGADPEPSPKAKRSARGRRMGRLPGALSGDRARLMLQSLTVPGWGQATIGQRRSALAFGLLEVGIWGSFTAFRIQQHMRRETYERTARLFGGIDLGGREEEYRRIVGLYISSEEYNRLVVRRDAANLYFGDPAGYDAYIAAHEIRGAGAWVWNTEEDFLRYRAERQATQRAAKHAQDALAVAVINRLLSVIHVSRSHPSAVTGQTSWRVECAPVGGDPTAFRLALRADF
jgi:hypothetical protein